MSASVIRGRYVVTGGMDGGPFAVIEDGAVRQENGMIVEVGPRGRPDARPLRRTRSSARPTTWSCPAWSTATITWASRRFSSARPTILLELWFASRMAARDVDPYLDTLYSAFEMLESGITTVQHLHGWRGGPAARVRQVAERVLQAYEDVGMRVAYSYALRDQNRLVYEADEAFCARLPRELGAQVAEYLGAQTIPLPDHLRLFEDLWEHAGRNRRDRVRVQLAPANLHWCSDEALRALGDRAEKFDVGLHMHLVETAYQKEYARRRGGTTAARPPRASRAPRPAAHAGPRRLAERVGHRSRRPDGNDGVPQRELEPAAAQRRGAAQRLLRARRPRGARPRRGRHQRRPRHVPGDAAGAAPSPRAGHGRRRPHLGAGAPHGHRRRRRHHRLCRPRRRHRARSGRRPRPDAVEESRASVPRSRHVGRRRRRPPRARVRRAHGDGGGRGRAAGTGAPPAWTRPRSWRTWPPRCARRSSLTRSAAASCPARCSPT